MPDFNNMRELNIGLLSFSLLITVFILTGCLFERGPKKAYMKSLIVLLAMNAFMQAGELGIWIFENNKNATILLRICGFFSYGGGAFMVVAYGYCLLSYVNEREKLSYKSVKMISLVSGVYLVLVAISTCNGMIFKVDSQGRFMDGALFWITWIFDPLLLLIGMVLIIYYRYFLGKIAIFSLIGFGTLFFMTMVLQPIWYPVPELLMTTLSLILVYMFCYGEQTRQLAEKEKKIVQNQINVAISQIQPHFLYNTLSTIAQLCNTDPETAGKVTVKFAKYLRTNLENMDDSTPVEFHKELEHVKTYLWIEKIRFQEDLNVVYDIETEDFYIPPLSIQPFVENAVKHGMMGKTDGVCTITIATRDYESSIEVNIKDDGCGFDVNATNKDDGRQHIGIQSVKSRIEYMLNGKVHIESIPGMGTCVTITIPKSSM